MIEFLQGTFSCINAINYGWIFTLEILFDFVKIC